MGKFIEKVNPVEAVQWLGDVDSIVRFMRPDVECSMWREDDSLYVESNNVSRVKFRSISHGTWIVRNDQGVYYAFADRYFKKKFRILEEDDIQDQFIDESVRRVYNILVNTGLNRYEAIDAIKKIQHEGVAFMDVKTPGKDFF